MYSKVVVVLRWEPLIKNNARVSVWEALINKHPRVSVTTAGLLLLYLLCVSVVCFFFTIVSSGWDYIHRPAASTCLSLQLCAFHRRAVVF